MKNQQMTKSILNYPESNELIRIAKTIVNFRENFIFTIWLKRHICNFENSQLSHDLPILVKDRVISPFCKDFIFVRVLFEIGKLRICEVFTYAKFPENKTLTNISEFRVTFFLPPVRLISVGFHKKSSLQ